jgi:hypothetical protein
MLQHKSLTLWLSVAGINAGLAPPPGRPALAKRVVNSLALSRPHLSAGIRTIKSAESRSSVATPPCRSQRRSRRAGGVILPRRNLCKVASLLQRSISRHPVLCFRPASDFGVDWACQLHTGFRTSLSGARWRGHLRPRSRTAKRTRWQGVRSFTRRQLTAIAIGFETAQARQVQLWTDLVATVRILELVRIVLLGS